MPKSDVPGSAAGLGPIRSKYHTIEFTNRIEPGDDCKTSFLSKGLPRHTSDDMIPQNPCQELEDLLKTLQSGVDSGELGEEEATTQLLARIIEDRNGDQYQLMFGTGRWYRKEQGQETFEPTGSRPSVCKEPFEPEQLTLGMLVAWFLRYLPRVSADGLSEKLMDLFVRVQRTRRTILIIGIPSIAVVVAFVLDASAGAQFLTFCITVIAIFYLFRSLRKRFFSGSS